MKKKDTAISSVLAFVVFIAFFLLFRNMGCSTGCSACSACTASCATGCVSGCADGCSAGGRTSQSGSGCSTGSGGSASSGTVLAPKDELYINDYTGRISEEYKNDIVSLGAALEKSCGAQLVAVVIDNPALLGNNELWDYGTKLFNSWGIGSKENNDGALLLINVAQGEYSGNAYCIVGTGLETILPASEQQTVIDDVVLPLLDNGSFADAALQGYQALYNKLYNLLGGKNAD